jgi:sulfatase modifying factor 1
MMKAIAMRRRASLFTCYGKFLHGVVAISKPVLPIQLSFREGMQLTRRVAVSVSALCVAVLMACSSSLFAAMPVPQNFVLLRGGEFTMGSPVGESGRNAYKLFSIAGNETQHQVRLSDFYMSKYSVTVAEFRKFIEASGYQTDAEKTGKSVVISGGKPWVKPKVNWRHGVSGILRTETEENHPVLHISWNDAVAYCKWMSEKTGKTYRLPTEAEREYACRAGTRTPFNTGANLTTAQANYDGTYPYMNNEKGVYRENTVPVNSFAPNAWGLYNMHGNVWEWCSDRYRGSYYDECKAAGVVTNPKGSTTGAERILRGGGWGDEAQSCRSAYRHYPTSDYHNYSIGFRMVFIP